MALPGVALGLRTSALLWVLDMVVLSEICLMVNHAESLYWVLVAATVGCCAGSLMPLRPAQPTSTSSTTLPYLLPYLSRERSEPSQAKSAHHPHHLSLQPA